MRFGLWFCLVSLITGLVVTGGEKLSPDDLAFFEKKIRPALIEHCYQCHSEEEGKRKGGLWLDRKSGWELGGDSGPAIVPGDPEKSLFLTTVHYGDPDLEMPPDGKLPDKVIADFEGWIARGAPDPRNQAPAKAGEPEMDIEKGRQFWSFQPRKNDFSSDASVDFFINAGLKEKGLSQAPPADPESRLRRARIDLTGLIPTVAEQDEFLADPTDEKFEEMVDRWMASSAFGERWGRHWLDIARYADSSGGGRAIPFPDAWRFRDYVIDSFNEDRPLDDLIVSHIAGDLLPYEDLVERQQNLVASGFLVLGPINFENQNKAELDFEIVDEQLDTVGRSFLGMTIGCARCHDHKFDPIPTSDYYAMAGIFMNTNFVTHANVSQWHTEPIPPSEEVKAAIAAFEIEEKKDSAKVDGLKKELAALGRGAASNAKSVPASSLRGIVVTTKEAEIQGEWMESTSVGRWVGSHYIHDRNEARGTKSVKFTADLPTPGEYELRLAYTTGPNRNPTVPVEINIGGKKTTVLVNQKLPPEHEKLTDTLGVFTVGKGVKPVVTISNNSRENGVVIANAVQWLPLEQDKGEQPDKRETEKREKKIAPLEASLATAEKELKFLRKKAPDVPKAMSVVDRADKKFEDIEIRIRGVESNRGERVPRGFLQVAMWDSETGIGKESSGRLEFARWITDPKHPLTSRVMANRIWLKLMGEGIVRTPDNFGITGQAPTHPELLDYLAGKLIASGWSTKALVKEIILSDAYSMAGENPDSRGPEVDIENYLFWKAHRRSLDVESMRDAILTLSESLDKTTSGPSLPKGFKSEFGHQFTTKRRSVYVPVFRNSGFEMFSVFDFANPNFTMGKRFSSTIPTQALFLMNSELVHQHADSAASLLLQEPAVNDEARVELAFRKTLGRRPVSDELALAMNFLRESGDTAQDDDAKAWAALQRSLFACVDFRFLR